MLTINPTAIFNGSVTTNNTMNMNGEGGAIVDKALTGSFLAS